VDDHRETTGPPQEEDDDLESLAANDSRECDPPGSDPEPTPDGTELAALAASADGSNGRYPVQLGDEDATLDLRSFAETMSDGSERSASFVGAEPAATSPERAKPGVFTGASGYAPGSEESPAPGVRRWSRALLLPVSFALGLTAGALLFVGRGEEPGAVEKGVPAAKETAATSGNPVPPEAKPNRAAVATVETAERVIEPGKAIPEKSRPETPRTRTAKTRRPKIQPPEPVAASQPPPPVEATRTATPPGDSPGKPGDRSDMDRFLDDALQSPAAARAKEKAATAADGPGGDSDLPLVPSREQVTKAVVVLLPAIRGCAMGRQGTAMVSIVVRNDGRVARARVGGTFAGTAIGRCIEGVVRKARFPEFRQSTFRIQYPIAIRGGSRGAG
jgi:hypothetical protein